MVKRVVVAGCRYYNNYNEAKAFIDVCILNIRKQYRVVFLCGCCTGADALGERYAKENGFDVVRYPAQWEKYGKSAGPIRNRQMAEDADYVICFWDGKSRGTKSMIDSARFFNKPVRIKRI